MADPAQTSIVIPAFNEGAGRRRGRDGAARGSAVARDHRRRRWLDATARASTRQAAGAIVRAASVQQRQRRLGEERHSRGHRRVRADPRRRRTAQAGRRAPAGVAARRLRSRGRRARDSDAGLGRAAHRQRRPQLVRELSDRDGRFPISRPGFRAARREYLREFLYLLPNGFSSPTTITLSFIKAGYNVLFEPVEARQRDGHSKIRLARDGVKFFLILLRVITIFSPLRIFLPISGAAFARRRRLCGLERRHAEQAFRTARCCS